MQLPQRPLCVLCGVRLATTRDHVPPKGLFKGLDAQLITVPACSECNNGSSAEDEDLRFFISAQIGKQTEGSAKLWDAGAHKSVKRKTKLREHIAATMHETETTDDQGNRVVRLAFAAPVRTYQIVFERTTRGLYFFHTGRILPAKTRAVVEMLTGRPDLKTAEIRSLTTASIGPEACIYRFGISEANMDDSLWLYEFYRAHWVMVQTGECNESAV